MKTEVYSWRVSTDVKMALEREARRQKTSVAAVLDEAAQEYIKKRSRAVWEDDTEQKRMHAAVAKLVGTIQGTDPNRSTNVSKLVRESLRKRYGR
jgi:hypothetical protein